MSDYIKGESLVERMERRMCAARPTTRETVGWLVAVALGVVVAGANSGMWFR